MKFNMFKASEWKKKILWIFCQLINKNLQIIQYVACPTHNPVKSKIYS